MKQKIIIDTDIGDDIDDAFALKYAINSNKFDVVGVTTVFRNVEQRSKLTKFLLQTLNADVPVFAGENFPEKQAIKPWNTDTYNEAGYFNVPQYDARMETYSYESQHAVDYIIETILANPNEIILVGIGPLTNIAAAIKKNNSICTKVKAIYIMGGDFLNPLVEWNIFCDPEAAKIVLESKANIYLYPFEVTRQCILGKANEKLLNSNVSSNGKIISEKLAVWYKHYNWEDSLLHDPLTIACIAKDFCQYEEIGVEVVLDGDERAKTNKNSAYPPIKIATNVLVDDFLEDFMEKMMLDAN